MSNIYETKELSAGYGKKIVLENITIDVRKGEILTLIGPNGVGKSTLLRTLTAQLEPLGGIISLKNENLHKIQSAKLARELAIVMTERPETEYMSVYDVVAMGRYPYTGRFGKMTDEDKTIVRNTISRTGLSDMIWEDFEQLSDGQRQRVMLARAICQQPEVLILDEPTSFLDIRYKLEILTIIRQLAHEQGLCVIMSLHELDMAREFSDKVLCIKDGRVDRYGNASLLNDDYIYELFDVKREYLPGNTDDRAAGTYKRDKKARVIMVQGTMSNAGKSLIAAGLCRVFKQDGYRVAPFKSQNMALNSYITDEGLEMGRAQVMQAEAAGVNPSADMNPILLKPTTDVGSQVIVNGRVVGNMKAKDYFAYKTQLIPDIMAAYERLEEEYDIIVIEGAGSPAEINLKDNDIVNMGLAKMVDAPVLLVADIDRGGVFAQLIGTLELLERDERDRIEGLVINKFRGDKTILDPGITQIESLSGKSVIGTVPYMELSIDDEDSLSERLGHKDKGLIDIAVIRLPKISNFTDFHALELVKGVGVRYVSATDELGMPDLIILPGTKNTIADLRWLRETGLEPAIIRCVGRGVSLFGICGGYQMLCEEIIDDEGAEGGGSIKGIGLLKGRTIFSEEKITRQTEGTLGEVSGTFRILSGIRVKGYEIHMGVTSEEDQLLRSKGNVYGTYLHGIFDEGNIAYLITKALADKKGMDLGAEIISYEQAKEAEYDKLADGIRASFDMDRVYDIMERYYESAD